jgi:hypothetical protein
MPGYKETELKDSIMSTSKNDNQETADAGAGKASENSHETADNLRADANGHPINFLLELATDDNVETHEGVELKVEDVRGSTDNALLTKTELQKYDEYKREWQAALERPQESLDALALRERQIIEAAANHDWETLDKLRSEVAADLEKMQFIFSNIVSDMREL